MPRRAFLAENVECRSIVVPVGTGRLRVGARGRCWSTRSDHEVDGRATPDRGRRLAERAGAHRAPVEGVRPRLGVVPKRSGHVVHQSGIRFGYGTFARLRPIVPVRDGGPSWVASSWGSLTSVPVDKPR